MLKPGGQLCFVAFKKLYGDEAYDKLDEGKWCIYENRKAISPFYKADDPKKEYENVIKSVGFVDIHCFSDEYKPRRTENNLDGMYFGLNHHKCVGYSIFLKTSDRIPF